PESEPWLDALERNTVYVPASLRTGGIWQVTKPVRLERVPKREDRNNTALAEQIWKEHDHRAGPAVTLVVVNRVDTAIDLARALGQLSAVHERSTAIEVAHSRFRGR